MPEPQEMCTASRMQNMVQIRKKNIYFVTQFSFIFAFFTFRALGVESPRGGAIVEGRHNWHDIALIRQTVTDHRDIPY